jgi:hypothetical protein
MRTAFRLALAVLVLSAPSSPTRGAPAKPCLEVFTDDLVLVLEDEARPLLKALRRAGPEGQQGAGVVLLLRLDKEDGPQRLMEIVRHFGIEFTVGNPYPDVGSLLNGITRLTRVGPDGVLLEVPGLSTTVARLGVPNNLGLVRGTAGEIELADRLGGFDAIAGLNQRVTGAGGVVREVDVVQGPKGIDPLNAVRWEKKYYEAPFEPGHFTQATPGPDGGLLYPDARLTDAAEEFRREIIIESAAGDFVNWRWEISGSGVAHRGGFLELFRQQFDTAWVRERLTSGTIDDLKDEFEALVPSNLVTR